VNKINTVIFDMDGVLVNSEPVHQRLEKEMYEELGLNLTYEEQQSFVGMSAMDSWMWVINKYNLKDKPQDLLLKGRQKYLKVLHK
jgi:beta-phosphoglucomutase-like phosphatase (HAD superfamily)